MRLTFLLFIGISAALNAQSQFELEVKAAMAEHRYREVIAKLESAELDESLELMLVRAYRQTGQNTRALSMLTDIWQRDTTNRPLNQALAETYFDRRQYREAYDYFHRLTLLAPDRAYYHKLAGRSASRLLSLKPRAIEHYQQARQLQRDDRDAAYALALLFFELGQNLQARPITQEFVARDSSDLGMIMLDTRLAYLMEQYEMVIQNTNFMLAQGDTVPSVIRLYAIAQYQQKNYKVSRQWLEYLQELAPSEQVYFYLGMANYRLETYDTAAVYLQKAIEETRSPNLGDFYTQLAITLDKDGQFRQAVAAYKEAYALNNSPEMLFRLALIYDEELRLYPQAKTYYQEYLKFAGGYNSTEKLYAEDRLAEMKRADFMNVDD